MHALSEQYGLEHDNSVEESWKEAFLNQLSATCDSYGEIKHQLGRIQDTDSWKKFGMGMAIAGSGLGVAGAAPLLPTAATAMSSGIVYTKTVADLITAVGGGIGLATAAYGTNMAMEGMTGVNILGETLTEVITRRFTVTWETS